MPDIFDEAGTTLLDEGGGVIADELGPDVITATRQGGWWQLDSVIKYAWQEREFYLSQPPVACPRDGQPLQIAPPSASADAVELYCPFDGWQYPRDWDPHTMAGM